MQIASDIHLEFCGKTIPHIDRHADFLALLGDIGNPFHKNYAEFLHEQSMTFEKVFVLAGNHELYNEQTVCQVKEQIRNVVSALDNVFFLDQTVHDLDEYNIRLLGATLWSPIDAYSSAVMNDFRYIHVGEKELLSREMYLQWHTSDVIFLNDELEKAREDGKRVLVLTHHGPSKVMNGIYEYCLLVSAFTGNLEHLFQEPLIGWASGHVHSNVDVDINGIRCVSNALGYPGERSGYKENVVIHF
jgi:hypothetical protein